MYKVGGHRWHTPIIFCLFSTPCWYLDSPVCALEYVAAQEYWAGSTGGLVRSYFFVSTFFFIRLAAVSYHSKKVRTVASPTVRSVNKSRGTQNCIRYEPQYAICLVFTIRLYYKALKIDFIWSDMANNLQLQSSWRWPLWQDRSLWPWWKPVKVI